jgi:ribonuclease 2-5A
MYTFPHCQVVGDPDGTLIICNLRDIAKLNFFTRRRMINALEHTANILDILRHPAAWNTSENISFLVQSFSFIEKTYLPLDYLIIGKDNHGETSWAINHFITKTITKDDKTLAYDLKSFQEAIRFIRNKIAHFGQSGKDFQKNFGNSSYNIIRYFDRAIVGGGDLIVSLWEEINQTFEGLSHFWIKLVNEE